MARVAIIGPGAIGGTVAAALDAVGRHELILCGRRATRLTVETSDGKRELRLPMLTDPAAATPVDFVLVATKAYDVAAAVAWLPHLAPESVPVAVLQNGVEHRERFAPYLPPERVLPVIVWITAERPAPDLILQRAGARLTVPADDLGRAFARLFDGTSLAVEPVEDFASAAWRKLCGNAAGIVNTLIRKPASAVRDEDVAELIRAIVQECATVARAEGAVLPDDIADAVVRGLRAAPPDALNSLQADREAGRPLELDARNGIILRLARKHGIPVPLSSMAVTLLAASVRDTFPA